MGDKERLESDKKLIGREMLLDTCLLEACRMMSHAIRIWYSANVRQLEAQSPAEVHPERFKQCQNVLILNFAAFRTIRIDLQSRYLSSCRVVRLVSHGTASRQLP